MKLRFLPLARVELRAATAYYKAINPELAVTFKNEALDGLQNDPPKRHRAPGTRPLG